jgi:hypothetical protein
MTGNSTGTNAQAPVIKTSVKRNEQTVTLNSQDLLDRVVNLRFIHKPKSGQKPRTWTIRSDYEVVYFPPKGMQYIPCVQKPSIKVEMKYVSNRVAISITIDVESLFIKNPADLETGGSEPLEQIEIQMGYRTQMPNWATDPWYSKNGTLEQFMALFDGTAPIIDPGFTPPTKIVAQVLYAEQLKNPPDRMTRFHCVIGSAEPCLVWRFTESQLANDIAQQRSTHWLERSPRNNLPQAFFLLISRRFIRTSRRHSIDTKVVRRPTNNNFVQAVSTTTQQITMFDDNLNTIDVLTEGLGLENGRLSSAKADLYGTIVYMSDVLWTTPLQELPQWGLTDAQKAQAVPIEHKIPTEQFVTLEAQMLALCQEYPFLRFYTLGDGNILAYHVKENINDLASMTFVKENQLGTSSRKQSIVKLPAVYDITWGGTRQIRMPYIGGVFPMMTVAFPTRYALNDLVGAFYKPKPGHTFFLVLLMDISFATVSDDNMMTLTTTDITGPDTPVTNPDGSITPKPITRLDPAAERNKTWRRVTLTVVQDFTGLTNTVEPTWAAVIQLLLASATGFGDSPPTATDALAALQTWNSDLFSPARKNGYPSPESKTYGQPLGRLFSKWNPINPGVPDTVVVQLPYKPSYPPEEQMQ